MYATTYDFDEEVLVEIAVVDDLIFYSQGDYPIWYMTSSCTLYPCPILNVTAHDVWDVIIAWCAEWVRSPCELEAPSELCSILHAIYKTYSRDNEERYFQPHQLDNR